MTISTPAIVFLAENGVDVAILRRRGVAVVTGGPSGDAARRVAQYQLALDAERRLRWSIRLMGAKLRGQLRLLRRLLDTRVDRRAALAAAIGRLSEAESRVHSDARNLDTLRGLEGAAAAHFFGAFQTLFPPALGFRDRNRRPPRDPVNAALSLGYVLAFGLAVEEIHRAGLDPYIGFYHDLTPQRASLACDLIEPLRPAVDHLVYQLFHDRKLRGENFGRDGETCLLGKAGRRTFYAAWSLHQARLSRTLRHTLARLVRALNEGEAPARTLPQEMQS